jgi:hypothetical protein
MNTVLNEAHTPANCRWSRLGKHFSFVAESDQPEARWVCVREAGVRRPLQESECASCEFWEPTDEWRAVEAERAALWPE